MDTTLKSVCTSLDDLSESILKAFSNDKTMSEQWGWNFPPLNRHDLANLAKKISDKLKQNEDIEISESDKSLLESIPPKVALFKNKSLQYFFNGHGNQSVPMYISLIEWINSIIEPLFSWKTIQDNKMLPTQLTKRLRSIQAELDEMIPGKDDLKNQIDLIRNATMAAETLPTDLDRLKEAREKVNKFSLDAAELYGKIDTYYKDIEKISAQMVDKRGEADKIVAQCEDVYKITTTKGLAGAFDQKAKKLTGTMWIWVFGLLLALVIGGYIGASRFEILSKSLQDTNPKWGIIWMDFILSIIGLAAPIWFAWLATKQIYQRFRLAEDYSFKATVAKAYEGYRREAARIDETFEARLFSSALTRLDEPPLRLVENDHYGSPWHEFFNSSAFQNALNTIPDLKNQFISLAKEGINGLK
ncbi:MAG TPA: hypothetical protein VG917_05450, partial [Patescibacteria group bacterium]|nr:hypothetical protein [Patescibacteria group bacterium]